MTDILLALILLTLILNIVLSSAWWRRAKANVPYAVKTKTVAIKRSMKRG